MSDIRFILTEYENNVLSYSINVITNRLETINLYKIEDLDRAAIGDIFVARVTNVAKNLNAVFIDYQKGKRGYLPINNKYTPVLLNRKYDGQLKAGDEVLVQFEKEAVRSKEPVFTINLSISGKYSVITNANKIKGVSKKCSIPIREKLLKAIPNDIEYGIIIRTNAAELISSEENSFYLSVIETECRQLSAQMNDILSEGIHRTCYSRVWQSPLPYITELRDMHNINYSYLVTDNVKYYEQLLEFTKKYASEMTKKLVLYTDDYSLNKLYSIETKINELIKPKVWLKSGAYLIIEKTEAMYVIDVNSGKNISKKVNAEYILSINLEAAREVMYQIRLRNLTGIILVDFINMESYHNKELLMQELKALAKNDMVQTTIVDMTALELVEITRQKIMKSFADQLFSNSRQKTIDNNNCE